ncbi:hypothetical protein OIE68_37535 [Nocardia vinacea]|uniref:hypothetical protein n=1 Tax=Nocardia vinacea TaxID=96468 RepID=UPI002E158CBB|nr:hypothetical protein OIE68_37535 [Nocardia vinacea]
MSERSERIMNTAASAVMPEPSVSEAQAPMSELSERIMNTAASAVMPEPSVSEAQA